MFKRGGAPASGRSPVASRIPMSGSGEERTAREVEGVARERNTVERNHVLGGGKGWTPGGTAVGAGERMPEELNTCASAARGGHLEVLQWARANGCPWDEKTCARAVDIRHLESLQWARATDCPWNGHMLQPTAMCWYLRSLAAIPCILCQSISSILNSASLDF